MIVYRYSAFYIQFVISCPMSASPPSLDVTTTLFSTHRLASNYYYDDDNNDDDDYEDDEDDYEDDEDDEDFKGQLHVAHAPVVLG